MSEFLLGDARSHLFHLVLALEDFSKDEFLEAHPDGCLLQVPVEGAFPELSAEAPGPKPGVLDTQRVSLEDLKTARRSKRVDNAEVHFVTAKESGEPISVGRATECDIVLDAAGVSRKHAELRKALGQWQVTDLESNNGTFVNAKQLESGAKAKLASKTQVWFGSYRTMFLFSEDLYDLVWSIRSRGKK